MNIAFVIVNYNDVNNTIDLLEQIKDFKCLKKIVVVDNASTDDISKLEKIELDNYKLIKNNKNFGYAYGMNIGAKYINDLYDNAYICFSNTDIKIKSEKVFTTLANMIDDDVRCVMPKVKEKDIFKYGWKLTPTSIDLLDSIPYFNRKYRGVHRNYDEKYFDKKEVYVDVIYGCFFMISGSTLKSIDYFDDKTFLYYEEYILAQKLKKMGYKSMVNTSTYVEHIHNATIGNNISNKRKYKIYKKSQLYYEKHYNNANIIYMILFYILYLINMVPYVVKCIKK